MILRLLQENNQIMPAWFQNSDDFNVGTSRHRNYNNNSRYNSNNNNSSNYNSNNYHHQNNYSSGGIGGGYGGGGGQSVSSHPSLPRRTHPHY